MLKLKLFITFGVVRSCEKGIEFIYKLEYFALSVLFTVSLIISSKLRKFVLLDKWRRPSWSKLPFRLFLYFVGVRI